jgi:ABC-type siderophore export system fused ATPase/permease subunit
MDHVGLLIFFSLVGAFICAKARVASGAVAFSLVAVVLFVSTPLGSGLPGAVTQFLTAVNSASTPVLTKQTHDREAVG